MKKIPLYLLSFSSAFAADNCSPSQPAACNLDSCTPCYCLGPANAQSNPPVRPYTCDGDVEITASALYWKATQDGMEFAYKKAMSAGGREPSIVDAEFLSPNFKANPGFKLGVAYHSPCDGWDLGVAWTNFQGKASTDDSALLTNVTNGIIVSVPAEGRTLDVLWTAFQGTFGVQDPSTGLATAPHFVSALSTHWTSRFDIVDIQLGREYWVSKYLDIRPFIGVRLASINQRFIMEMSGGYWGEIAIDFGGGTGIFQPPLNGEVTIDNDFRGAGVESGLDLTWHLSCGWSIYSNLAAAILYGRFNIDHDENYRLAESPFSKTTVLDTEDSFRASRAVMDLGLGVQWSALVCDCKYGVTLQLGWEQHLYFHQIQMWRVKRKIANTQIVPVGEYGIPNNSGENDFTQKRGTLSTNGLTLTFKFDF